METSDDDRYAWNDRPRRRRRAIELKTVGEDDTGRRFVEAIVVLLSITGAATMLGWWLS